MKRLEEWYRTNAGNANVPPHFQDAMKEIQEQMFDSLSSYNLARSELEELSHAIEDDLTTIRKLKSGTTSAPAANSLSKRRHWYVGNRVVSGSGTQS
jgi:hypothetical protein